MAIERKPDSIFELKINSVEEMEAALKSFEQQTSAILDCNRLDRKYIYSIEQSLDTLDMVYLFDTALHHSQGFAVYSQITEQKTFYQILIKSALVTCTEILTPLLLSAFKCHQQALARYMDTGEANESARDEMTQTGEIAETISIHYEKLSVHFRVLSDHLVETIKAVQKEQEPMYAADPVEKNTLTSLGASIQFLCKTRSFSLNVYIFLKNAFRHSKDLTEPSLADPHAIEKMGLEVSEQEKHFYSQLEIFEKILVASSPKPSSSLDQVVQSMKTGYDRVKKPQSGTPVTDLVKAARLGSIDQEFEKSYLNWLALAKVNQAMIAALKDILKK